MARQLNRLNALGVKRLKKPGKYSDGYGLYLQIEASGTKSWVFRYKMRGRKNSRYMGLGSLITLSLLEARQRAEEQRKLIAQGIDPIEEREKALIAKALADAKAMTFKQSAEKYIDQHKAKWSNAKHAEQWASTLERYAYPVLGNLPVAAIDVGLVHKVLKPIWNTKTETASRLRSRIESILSWAKALNYRTGDNPAEWRGTLDQILPHPSTVQDVIHHKALPYEEIGTFMEQLRSREGVGALALEFLILTAARTGQVTQATWDEIDLESKLWKAPREHMKLRKEHRVPLSNPALAVLKTIKKEYELDAFVFPGGKEGKPLSGGAMESVLKRMGWKDVCTVHGFRSTLYDWAAEQTNYPNIVIQMALAHSVGDKTEAAYRRGDLLKKRERLMSDWARYCGRVSSKAEVIPINRRRAQK